MTEESRQTEPELSDAEVAGLLDELGEITLEQIRGAHSKQPPGEFLRMQETTTTHREQVDQRLFADWTGRQDAAIDCLKKLPKPGQSLHIIAPGTFNGTDIIPAIIRLDGAKCARECYATTLGFSEGNVKLLAAMLDSGQVKPDDCVQLLLRQSLRENLQASRDGACPSWRAVAQYPVPLQDHAAGVGHGQAFHRRDIGQPEKLHQP